MDWIRLVWLIVSAFLVVCLYCLVYHIGRLNGQRNAWDNWIETVKSKDAELLETKMLLSDAVYAARHCLRVVEQVEKAIGKKSDSVEVARKTIERVERKQF